MTEKRPAPRTPWLRMQSPHPLHFRGVLASSSYYHERNGVTVISVLELAEAPDGRGDSIPQWHISISRLGKRPSDRHVRRVLRDFGLLGAEEDNHHPGAVRSFWLPVDPSRRVECQCKTDEDVIVERDGYRWTNPREGEGACRGCELERMMGKPCSIHRRSRSA